MFAGGERLGPRVHKRQVFDVFSINGGELGPGGDNSISHSDVLQHVSAESDWPPCTVGSDSRKRENGGGGEGEGRGGRGEQEGRGDGKGRRGEEGKEGRG